MTEPTERQLDLSMEAAKAYSYAWQHLLAIMAPLGANERVELLRTFRAIVTDEIAGHVAMTKHLKRRGKL